MTGKKEYQIKDNVNRIKSSLPDNVYLVAAAKTRLPEEVNEAIDAGIEIVGYNYIQEAEALKKLINGLAKWHMIGHLQRNKAKKQLSFLI